MMKHFKNCELSVFVTLVLEDFFDSNSFSGLGDGGLEDHTEGSITNDLLSVVSHALLLALSISVVFHLNLL